MDKEKEALEFGIKFLEEHVEELKKQIEHGKRIGADQYVIIKEKNLEKVLYMLENSKK